MHINNRNTGEVEKVMLHRSKEHIRASDVAIKAASNIKRLKMYSESYEY